MGCFNSTERREKQAEENELRAIQFFATAPHEDIFNRIPNFQGISLKPFEAYVTRNEIYEGVVSALAEKLVDDINTKDENGFTLLDRVVKKEMDTGKPREKWFWFRITNLRRAGATSQFELPPSGAKEMPRDIENQQSPAELRSQYGAEVIARVRKSKGALPVFVKISLPSWRDDGTTAVVVKTSSGEWHLQRSEWYREDRWVDVKYNASSQTWYRALNESWSADKEGIKETFLSEAFGL